MRAFRVAAAATPLVALVFAFPMISNGTFNEATEVCEFAGGLELIEEWRYAPPETSSHDRLIGLLSSITRHPESGVYVVDLRGRSVLHLSPDGDFIRRIGRPGEGPGEFRSPTIVRATEQGFAVFDRLAGISFFDTTGSFQRIVRLQPFPSQARDFRILENGDLVVAGAVSSSDHAVHMYSPDGEYLGGMGQVRMDLAEPILRARYNNGYIAEAGAGRLAYARPVPFEFLLFEDSELAVTVTHTDILRDYVREVATPLEGGGWKFEWRHPSLSSFTRLSDGCFLAAGAEAPRIVSDQVQVGAESFFGEEDSWFASVEAYYRTFDGVASLNAAEDPNDDTDALVAGNGDAYGVDFYVKRDRGATTGWISVSFLKTDRSFPDTRVGIQPQPWITYPPVFDRRFEIDLALRRPLDWWGLEAGVRANFGTGLPYTKPLGTYQIHRTQFVRGLLDTDDGEAVVLGPRNGARFPARHRVDLSLRKTITKSWGTMTPYLSVINVYNKKNVLFYFFDYQSSPPVRQGVSMIPFLPTVGFEVSF